MLSISLMLLAVLATGITAQSYMNQTGPWLLHIKGESIDGYGVACHAGAALEGLCYAEGGDPGSSNSYQFWFNYTGSIQVDDAEVGIMSYKLPVNINGSVVDVPSIMDLTYQPNSNIAAPMFGTSSYGGFNVGFDADGKLFAYSYTDDSTYEPDTRPDPSVGPYAYYTWYVCWQYIGGYYYNAVGWAQTVPPHNPTCQAVEITQETPSS